MPSKPPTPTRPDPVAWCERFLGDRLWSLQRDIIRASMTKNRIAVKAGHGVGKTHLAARIAIYHLMHAGDSAMLLTTAPTFRQVQDLLWREIRRAYTASVYRGCPIAPKAPAPKGPRWVIDPSEPERILALGVAAANANNLQGYHDRDLIAIIDEAAGVADWVWGQILSFSPRLVLAIGNPTDPESEFAKCFDSSLWSCYTIPVSASPNISGEAAVLWGEQNRALATTRWVDEVRERYGEGSPYWCSRVLAEFPDAGADALIPARMFDGACGTAPHPPRWRAFGVDLAELGGDQTIVTVWDENALVRVEALPPADLMQTTGRIMQMARELRPDGIGVDDTGLVGVTSRLRELLLESPIMGTSGHHARVVPIVPGAGCTTDDARLRYANLRAEMSWELREGLRSRDAVIAVASPRLREEGRKSTYQVLSTGRIQIEPKDSIRLKIYRSPDTLDAAMYGWHVARQLARRFVGSRTQPRATHDHERIPERFASQMTAKKSLYG